MRGDYTNHYNLKILKYGISLYLNIQRLYKLMSQNMPTCLHTVCIILLKDPTFCNTAILSSFVS